MKKFFAWGDRNATSIYTGCFVALLMSTIILVQGMKHTSREVDHFTDKIELIKENNELSESGVIQFEMIENLIRASEQQSGQIDEAQEIMGEQADLIRKLIEYLKKIDHWPPKSPPSAPADPDKWI